MGISIFLAIARPAPGRMVGQAAARRHGPVRERSGVARQGKHPHHDAHGLVGRVGLGQRRAESAARPRRDRR